MNKKGAEGDFKNTLFAYILVALFGMLIINAVISLANTYSKDTSDVVEGSLSLDKFNKSISSIEQNSKALKERFDKGSVWSAIAGVVVEGIFGIAKDMINMILLPFDLVNDVMIDTLGVPAFVTSVILGLVILGIIFGIWRILKIGE